MRSRGKRGDLKSLEEHERKSKTGLSEVGSNEGGGEAKEKVAKGEKGTTNSYRGQER